MTDHTPGPWHIDGAEITNGEKPLALCCSTEANARLIAAAPDMYEYLKNMYAQGRLDDPDHDVAKILAKAEGGTQ